MTAVKRLTTRKIEEAIDMLRQEPYVLLDDLDFREHVARDRDRFGYLMARLQQLGHAVHPIARDPKHGVECLPCGPERTIGMRLAKRADDAIYAAYLCCNVRSGIGKVRKNVHAADGHLGQRLKSAVRSEARMNGRHP